MLLQRNPVRAVAKTASAALLYVLIHEVDVVSPSAFAVPLAAWVSAWCSSVHLLDTSNHLYLQHPFGPENKKKPDGTVTWRTINITALQALYVVCPVEFKPSNVALDAVEVLGQAGFYSHVVATTSLRGVSTTALINPLGLLFVTVTIANGVANKSRSPVYAWADETTIARFAQFLQSSCEAAEQCRQVVFAVPGGRVTRTLGAGATSTVYNVLFDVDEASAAMKMFKPDYAGE